MRSLHIILTCIILPSEIQILSTVRAVDSRLHSPWVLRVSHYIVAQCFWLLSQPLSILCVNMAGLPLISRCSKL